MFMFVTGVPGAISAGFLLDKFKKFKIIGLITSILGTYEPKLNQFYLKLQKQSQSKGPFRVHVIFDMISGT